MRLTVIALTALLLAGCEAYTDPEAYQRHVNEFFGSPGGKVVAAPTSVLLYGAANSQTYDSTVHTPSGTYDSHTLCSFGTSCDITVKKR